MDPRYVVNVEVAVVRDDQYLLAYRAEDEAHAGGTLSLIGGKVEGVAEANDVLERTARRELREEVGVEVEDLRYVESKAFVADDATRCVDIVFLARHRDGVARPREPDEVAEVAWLTAEELADHPDAPPWTRRSVELAERRRSGPD